MVAKSTKEYNFNPEELEVNQFMQGFAKGFEASEKDLAVIETVLKARIESNQIATDQEAAKIAYSLGFSTSAGIAAEFGALAADDFDFQAVRLGYSTAIKDEQSRLDDEEMQMFLNTYFESKQKKSQEDMEKQEQSDVLINLAAGEKFMAENAKKAGVVTMENGMQYIVLKQSTGRKPTLADKVTTHYHGTLINGNVFDSSVERGKPSTFPLSGVIKGWQEGIPLMSVGSKYIFFIPAELAYGNRAIGASIPSGSTLIFEVELIRIN